MVSISLREGVTHPIALNEDDLLMDVELIDDGAFCALKDMNRPARITGRMGVCLQPSDHTGFKGLGIQAGSLLWIAGMLPNSLPRRTLIPYEG